METANFIISSCRYCRYYSPEGRRGGVCQQLGVPVQGSWKACALAVSPFANEWQNLEEIALLENTLSLHPVQGSYSNKKEYSKIANS